MNLAILKETYPGEKRVSIIPQMVPAFKKMGLTILVESKAGEKSFFTDKDYENAGATVISLRKDILSRADIVAYVRAPGADKNNLSDLEYLKKDAIIVGHTDPLAAPEIAKKIAEHGITSFSLELIPRITRAQSMDVLSSMATIAGYKAVILAANYFGRIFPMFMTAAGTLLPAKVFIVGAGVAGLQAIAIARKLGAQVEAYDVRPAVKEQIQSLGAKFVELPLETKDAQDKGGYAKALDDEILKKQRELMSSVIANSDIIITTASVPGKKAPVLITEDQVKGMKPGSVIIDIAAEKGGNVALTKPGEIVEYNGVKIVGLVNAASEIPTHASQMYSNNIKNFLQLMIDKEGNLNIDLNDEIIKGTLITKNGEIVHQLIKDTLAKD
jgi:H+-translocating NAD(P) transhydrogenase subunit alpha